MDRRRFVKTAALGSAALAAAPLGQAAKKKSNSETLVAQLYGSLNDEQKKVVARPFDHPLREKVDNNWSITKRSIVKRERAARRRGSGLSGPTRVCWIERAQAFLEVEWSPSLAFCLT